MLISIIVEIYVYSNNDFDYNRNYHNLYIRFRLYSKFLVDIRADSSPNETMLFQLYLWWDIYLIQNIQKEHHMLRNKPTVGSVCGGVCGALSLFKYKPTKD